MGERFAGRYELVDHLGEGGSGTVWRAWDHKAQVFVAAKLLRQRDAGALLRFVREQSMRVAHPHVVAPTGWAAEDDVVLLTMDLVAGGSVETLRSDYGTVPVSTALALADQLLDALAAVHAAGLVHRDVKPSNLLLEPTGTGRPFLRLADFGIAVAVDDPRLTDTGMVIGTPGYVPPEVLHGAGPDPRQDLWSVSATLRHVLTGQRPGTDLDGQAAASRAHEHGLPPEVEKWLAWLGDPRPERRPVTAAAARAGLGALPVNSGHDAAVEPLEVFDHLVELPAGWSASGPVVGEATRRPPRPLPVIESDTRSDRDTVMATRKISATPRADRPGSAGRSRVRLTQLVAAGVLALLAVVALVLAVRASSSPEGGDGSGGAVTTARAGQDCAFSEAGQRRTDPDGAAIVCTLRDGRYEWSAG